MLEAHVWWFKKTTLRNKITRISCEILLEPSSVYLPSGEHVMPQLAPTRKSKTSHLWKKKEIQWWWPTPKTFGTGTGASQYIPFSIDTFSNIKIYRHDSWGLLGLWLTQPLHYQQSSSQQQKYSFFCTQLNPFCFIVSYSRVQKIERMKRK